VNQAATDPINLNGNSFINTIKGNAGDNIIDGRGGNDTLTAWAAMTASISPPPSTL